jgi:quinol monooxygenase YgiN
VIALVWQFDVKAGQNDAFEALYGADGAWTALSRRSRSYLGSSFLRDLAMSNRYLLIEYWSEMVVYEKHHADFQDETEDLERRRDALVEVATPLGLFNALDVPDRAGPTWSQRSGRSE